MGGVGSRFINSNCNYLSVDLYACGRVYVRARDTAARLFELRIRELLITRARVRSGVDENGRDWY